MAGVLVRSWDSGRPLNFSHIFHTKTLGVSRSKEICARITSRIDLWERGLHAGLVGGAEAEGASREGKAASGEEEEDKAIARSYHNIILSRKLWQASGNRQGGGWFSSWMTNA